jgi:predicted dehydrogenase
MVIQVGIVGTGFGEKVHIPGFQAIPRVKIMGIWGRNSAKAKTLAEQQDIPLVFDTVEAMAQHPDIDAIAISTPPHLHYEQSMTVLHARKALFCEKPLALNRAQAQAMLNLAEANQVVHGVDFEFRAVPHWQYLKRLIERGMIGPIRFVEVAWQVEGRADAKRAWNWYAEKEKGGGALGAIGSHCFDYLEWLLCPISQLSAQLSTSIRERPDLTGTLKPVDSDDTCNLLLEFSDGTPGVISLSTATWRGQGHWLRIYGESGTLVLGSDNLLDYVHGFKLWLAKPGEDLVEQFIPQELQFVHSYPDGRIAPFIGMAERFIHSLETGLPMTPSLKEGLRSQVLIDATDQAHQQKSWVLV